MRILSLLITGFFLLVSMAAIAAQAPDVKQSPLYDRGSFVVNCYH